MLLKLPPSLQYPITITKVHKQVGEQVAANETLFDYTFKVKVTWGSPDGDEDEIREETHGSKFESSVEGTLKIWKVWETDVIHGPREVVEIEEACPHDVQVNGMCVVCGKDMTLFSSYNSETTDAERAPIRMTHDTQSLTVSQEEATRVEDAAKRRLLAARKLSLVVDLDQTIIHAAVDPTIAEWQKDKDNPNYDAVKDVRAFQLVDDGPGMRGCWYYIKLRPGLQEFLEHISTLYELHIYTMGTRQYAQQIAKIVDPRRKYFGDRILSRDESGSMTAKSLQRLFPVDTKMVVIIDDRGDVWKWSDNLVKVTPFDFFIGIGDINSSFLPKKQEIQAGPDVKKETPSKPEEPGANGATPTDEKEENISALEQLVAMGGGDDPVVRELQTVRQEETIASQVVDKPLLQMQKKLDEEDEALAAAEEAASSSQESSDSMDEDTDKSNGHVNDSTDKTATDGTGSKDTLTLTHSHQRHSVLHNDDRELTYLETSLTNVHAAFFAEYDRRRLSNKGGRVSTLAGKRKVSLTSDSDSNRNDLMLVPDIKHVMPAMKRKALHGVFIVFSGVLPLGTDIQNADISIWAKSFGAIIESEVRKRTTHVVAARTGTAKVKQALKRKDIKVVTPKWLFQCFSEWRKVDEVPYLLEPRLISSTQESKTKASDDDFLRSFLSSSEEDSDGSSDNSSKGDDDDDTESETRSRSSRGMVKRLKLDTGLPVDDDDVILDSEGEEDRGPPLSPLTLDIDERNDIDQELKDFLGSDVDTDSDTESVASLNFRKRKRDEAVDTETDGANDTGPEDAADPLVNSKVDRTSGLRNAIRPAAELASEFNTVPAAVLNGKVPDDEETIDEQVAIEDAEREEEAEEEDSDDELARELERELEDDEDSDEDVDETGAVTGGGNAEEGGFMGATGGGGGGVNDIEEEDGKQGRQIEGWSQDLDTK